jgi:lipopolysaccharide cholinephosphotransferase
MIQFDEKFFEGEVRKDFYIEPMMKRVWAAQMEVLAVIDEICKKHEIKYFADWGTLLGTVREGGFVPWDDDMDIAMLRPDYTRFIQLLSTELPEGFVYINIHNEEMEDSFNTRVLNSNSIRTDEQFLQRYHGCPYAVGIDIFPVDYVPRDKNDEKVQIDLINIVCSTAQMLSKEDVDQNDLSANLRKIEELTGYHFHAKKSLLYQLNILGEGLCAMYGPEDADYVTSMLDLAKDWDYYCPKEAYEEAILMPFEGVFEMPVPKGYDKLLEIKYGDWKTPVQGVNGHGGAVFFYDQEESLRLALKERGMSGERFGIDVDHMRPEYEEFLRAKEAAAAEAAEQDAEEQA